MMGYHAVGCKKRNRKIGVDFFLALRYNSKAVSYAAIAQSVERILGKDEVASSNLASSSKPLKLLAFQGFFLFLTKSHDLILHIKILIRDEVIIMKKIEMPTGESKNFLEVFEMFVISQTAKGVADITIRIYRCSF